MATRSSKSFRLPSVLKPPPEIQVFGNPLLMHLILKNLGKEDILRAALVSKDWRANSREFLNSKNCNIPVCVRVKYDNPCRKLAELNEFLKTTSSSDAPTITFNGIHYISTLNERSDGEYRCQNCWFKYLPYDERLFRKEIVQLYDQILKSVKFKYIWLKDCHRLDYRCPSAQLLNFILDEKRTEIVELDYSDDRFVLMSLLNLGKKRLYPNLRVFGAGSDSIHGRSGSFPITAPSLKQLTQFPYNPSNPRHCRIENFPHQAVTVLGDVHGMSSDPESVKTALEFLTDFQPKINCLYFAEDHPRYLGVEGNYGYGEDHRCSLSELGRLISPYLKILKCSTLAVASLASSDEGGLAEENGKHNRPFRHCFPNLEKLQLDGSVGVDFMDWLNGVGYSKGLPRLREVEIYFTHPRYTIYGPVNSVTDCNFKSVETLTLTGSRGVLFSTLGLLQIFSNVRFLSLVNFGLKCDVTDHIFAQIMSAVGNLPLLEEVYFDPNISPLRELNLDHLFDEDDLGNKTFAAGGQSRRVYKPLVLTNTKIRKIEISYYMCWPRVNYAEGAYTKPGRFVVSNRTAQWIKQHCPGFSISVKITKRCLSRCRCPHPSCCLSLSEHLKPFASILFEDGTSSNEYYLHLKF